MYKMTCVSPHIYIKTNKYPRFSIVLPLRVSHLLHSLTKYRISYFLTSTFLNSGKFCSINFKLFGLSELLLTTSQYKNKARVICIVLANKYGIAYIPQLLPNNVTINSI